MTSQKKVTSDDDAPESMAALIGQTFALVQHGMDKVIEWGFGRIEAMPKKESVRKIENPALRRAATVGRGVVRFFGGMGKAYYEHYEKLKADEQQKESHPQ